MSDKFKEWFPFIMFFPLFLVLAGVSIGMYQKQFLEEYNSGMFSLNSLATIHVCGGILGALFLTLLLIETLKRMTR